MPPPARPPPASVLPPAAPPAARRSLVDELQGLLDSAGGGPMPIGRATARLRERGPAMVMLLLTLPCVVPGLASAMAYVTGPAVTVFGVQLALRLPPWLPGWLARRELSAAALARVVGLATRWGGPVEKLLRPRMAFMLHPAADVVVGLALAFLGVFLFVPWLVPLSNELPAVVMVVLLLGLIERDGVFVGVGLLLTLAIGAACGYVGALFWRYGFEGGLKALHHLRHATTTPAA